LEKGVVLVFPFISVTYVIQLKLHKKTIFDIKKKTRPESLMYIYLYCTFSRNNNKSEVTCFRYIWFEREPRLLITTFIFFVYHIFLLLDFEQSDEYIDFIMRCIYALIHITSSRKECFDIYMPLFFLFNIVWTFSLN